MAGAGLETAEAALARARALYAAGDIAAGARFTAEAVAAFPDDAALWNVRGVMLRQSREPQSALDALDRALALSPEHAGARTNRAGVVLDLARAAPTPTAALAALDEGLAHDPENLGLLEAKALILRRGDDRAATRAFVEEVVARHPDAVWPHIYLADLIGETEPGRALTHLRRALALDPAALATQIALAHRLSHSVGAEEAANLDEAHALASGAAAIGGLNANQLKVAAFAFARTCDFAATARLGDFRSLGRAWAEGGVHTALMLQLPRVESHEDRLELVEQHRICGRALSAPAERAPIERRPRGPGDRLRIGLLSSDLRRHPVGYFVEPLFTHLAAAPVELFAYGFDTRPPDDLSAWFAARARSARNLAGASDREAAQAIANDGLDLLIELGGSTAHNRLEVMAWRPAPRQASWLGYPHSAGLPAIDGLVCDPFNRPADPALLAEAPLVMPSTWIALGAQSFSDAHAPEPGLPETRQGALTFGTASNPYKYTAAGLAAWARIVAAVPGSRFAFIRPEAASTVFRANVTRAFAVEGVSADRLVFRAVRGAHLRVYDEVDITLDTFPLTGGTTTVEALWMGAPVISLRGEAFYERLSWSILANLGLEDLVADDLAGYQAAAVRLAADRERRAELRATLRARVRQSPLGQTERFSRDFFALARDFANA